MVWGRDILINLWEWDQHLRISVFHVTQQSYHHGEGALKEQMGGVTVANRVDHSTYLVKSARQGGSGGR